MPKISMFQGTFRCLREVEFDFRAPEDQEPASFVALVGANGAGKTSVLEAIAMTASSITGGESQFTSSSPGMLEWSLPHQAGVDVSVVFNATHPERSLRLACQALYVPSGYLPRLPAGQPLQHGPRASLDPDVALSIDESSWPRRISAVHQWWLHMHWEYPRTQTLDRLWHALSPFLGALRYAGVAPEDHLPRFRIGDTTVSFNQLSSGQRRIVLLFMEIAMHCGTDGLLLFDEPEAHCHPGWQRMLPEALGRLIPDGQVFVATHSPFLLEELAGHQVFLLGDEPW